LYSSLPWSKGRSASVCETVWSFFRLNTHLFDLKFVASCAKFRRDSYVEFQQKILFEKVFINFGHSKAILFPDFWNLALLSAIFLKLILRCKILKNFTQVLSYIVCIQLRRHVQKQNTKIDMTRRMQDVSFSGKTSFLILFPLSLRLNPWIFYLKFVPDVPYCVYWVVVKVSNSNSFHRIFHKFFIYYYHDRK